MIYGIKIAHGDHHAVEYGELIGPLTGEQADEVGDALEPYQVVWKEATPFEAWQLTQNKWNEGRDPNG